MSADIHWWEGESEAMQLEVRMGPVLQCQVVGGEKAVPALSRNSDHLCGEGAAI